jgi:hypothetical protein
MHEEPMTEPGLSLSSDLAILAFAIPCGNQALAVIIAWIRSVIINTTKACLGRTEIFDDRSRLSKHKRIVAAGYFDGHNWRLAQRMDLLELWWRQFVTASLVCLELIWDLPRHISEDHGAA